MAVLRAWVERAMRKARGALRRGTAPPCRRHGMNRGGWRRGARVCVEQGYARRGGRETEGFGAGKCGENWARFGGVNSRFPASLRPLASRPRKWGTGAENKWRLSGQDGNTQAEMGAAVISMTGINPKRSANMARIGPRDTAPELAARRILHRMGYRFRLHRRDLPGKPDIVLPRRRTIFLIHGCFWHRHRGCRFAYLPKTRVEFWQAKFKANVVRDRRVERRLRTMGWKVHVIWECETHDPVSLEARLKRALTHS